MKEYLHSDPLDRLDESLIESHLQHKETLRARRIRRGWLTAGAAAACAALVLLGTCIGVSLSQPDTPAGGNLSEMEATSPAPDEAREDVRIYYIAEDGSMQYRVQSLCNSPEAIFTAWQEANGVSDEEAKVMSALLEPISVTEQAPKTDEGDTTLILHFDFRYAASAPDTEGSFDIQTPDTAIDPSTRGEHTVAVDLPEDMFCRTRGLLRTYLQSIFYGSAASIRLEYRRDENGRTCGATAYIAFSEDDAEDLTIEIVDQNGLKIEIFATNGIRRDFRIGSSRFEIRVDENGETRWVKVVNETTLYEILFDENGQPYWSEVTETEAP